MVTLMIIIVLLATTAMVILSNIKRRIIKAEAGPSAEAPATKSDITYYVWNKLYDGNKMIKDIICFEVDGDCMEYVGINAGDVMYAKKIASPSKNSIKPFDILLLKVKRRTDNKTIYKIRMVEKINDDNTINTFYFLKEGGEVFKKISSKPHQFDQVQGIVAYKKATA